MVTGTPGCACRVQGFLLQETKYNNNMNCIKCGIFPVPPLRIEAGYHTCMPCASQVRPVRGVTIHTGKVGSEIQVLSAETYASNKRYFVADGARSAVKNFSKNIAS